MVNQFMEEAVEELSYILTIQSGQGRIGWGKRIPNQALVFHW